MQCKLFVNYVWCHDVCKSPIAGSGIALSERNAVHFYMQQQCYKAYTTTRTTLYSRGKLLSIPKEGRWVWQLRMAILFLFFLAALALAVSFLILIIHQGQLFPNKSTRGVWACKVLMPSYKQQISSLQPRRAARVTDMWLTGFWLPS